jgi:hypothetical protein
VADVKRFSHQINTDGVFDTHNGPPNANAVDVLRAVHDTELMPQNHNFGFQPPSRLEAVAQHADKKEANCNHPAIMF